MEEREESQVSERQFDILKTELKLAQQGMDKYDDISMKVKAWAFTLWVAAGGWAFQVSRKDVILLGIFILVMFWFFDALNKAFRQDYKIRRDEVAECLENVFNNEDIPKDFSSPKFPKHERKDVFSNMIKLHIVLPYLILFIVSLFLYGNF